MGSFPSLQEICSTLKMFIVSTKGFSLQRKVTAIFWMFLISAQCEKLLYITEYRQFQELWAFYTLLAIGTPVSEALYFAGITLVLKSAIAR